MYVAAMELHLRLEGCKSLKDKRRIVRGLIERLRRDFRVAAAETGDHDLWGNAEIGIACVSDNPAHAESIVQHLLDHLDSMPEIEVSVSSREIIRT